jgi:acyl-CoA thioester hydrolase
VSESLPTREYYPHSLLITTRWMDNDIYGHVNNVTYYSYFDTVVNEFMIRQGGLDIAAGPVIGLVVESTCKYHRALTFPETIEARLRVVHLGHSSVKHAIGLFSDGFDGPAATGHFVHVFVDRVSRKPTAIPAAIRASLQSIATPTQE